MPPRLPAEPIVVPAAVAAPRRGRLPVLASLAPLLAAAVMWPLTGSPFVLLFALLGPLVGAAALLDGRRAARRDARLAGRERERHLADGAAQLERRHAQERHALESAHPDVAGYLAAPDEIWRPDRLALVTAGRGPAASDSRVRGDDALAERARVLDAAPQPVALQGGICVSGPPVIARAVARGLVLQACLGMAPGRLAVTATSHGEWLEGLPHPADAPSALRLALVGPAEVPPAGAGATIAVRSEGAPSPPWCAVRLVVDESARAVLDADGTTREVVVETVGEDQARSVVRMLGRRAAELSPRHDASVATALREILPARERRRGSLRVAFGVADSGPAQVDLVRDGPHALVVGVTGTGKSELLVSWITALAAGAPTRDVTFLLVDFKGGTAFDPLRGLPHVAGVITDLDGEGATRAIDSLRAELRRRERILAGCAARDIDAAGDRLARLVVVVDEFAALVGDHPELQRVFVDVAARGRALGMHLVLGTQRAGGVVRETLLTNCPLRICLRVGDAAESRMLLDTDAAAALPGGVEGRGRALVRRAGDIAAQPIRVALAAPALIDEVIRGAADDPPAPPVSLPALPENLELCDLTASDPEVPGMLLALVDEPDRQTRSVLSVRSGAVNAIAIVGAAGSGKTNALDLLYHQAPGPTLRTRADPEQTWDVVGRLEQHIPRGALVLLDDVDAACAALPIEYQVALIAALERVVRAAPAHDTVVAMSLRRSAGPVARVVELMPSRLVLRAASRSDHLAANGDPALFRPDAPPGRGSVGDRRVQVPRSAPAPAQPAAAVPVWIPGPLPAAVVTRAPASRAAGLRAAWAGARVLDLRDGGPFSPAEPATVYVGDPEQWQRHWNLLADLRATGEIVIAADCAASVRSFTGHAELPPYCRPGSDRAWAAQGGGALRRVALPGVAG